MIYKWREKNDFHEQSVESEHDFRDDFDISNIE